MRLRRVPAEVFGGNVTAVGRGPRGGGARGGRAAKDSTPTPSDVAYAFANAWMEGDRPGMERRSAPDLVCRWVGFGSGPLEAVGLDRTLATGREFEQRHGVAASYSVVDALTGASHAAILFDLPEIPAGSDRSVRIAVYRVEAGRVTSITVYADQVG